MMKPALIAVASALALAACSPGAESGAESSEAASGESTLKEVLASDIRAEDRARDEYRRPAETLAFFQVIIGLRSLAEFKVGQRLKEATLRMNHPVDRRLIVQQTPCFGQRSNRTRVISAAVQHSAESCLLAIIIG